MSDVESSNLVVRRDAAPDELAREDRAWLDERLEEYRELLEYFHDH